MQPQLALYVAGWQALSFGLLLMAITTVTAFFSHTNFDGAIDVHFNPNFPFWFHVFEQLNAWLSTVIVFFIIGILLSKSNIRLIDVAGTLALARAPMLFAALIGFVPALHQLPTPDHLFAIAVWGLLAAIVSIWTIALMYNAFIISCNLKSNKAIVGFIISIVLAEIVSKISIYQFYHHLISK
ncbi:MAG: hypothetical protein EOP42_27635 [Sphingobacteriaceae bacterium]|nr:MAG: hypothetical protein EOP42_27635 [Sphingobacteriaceae bacterium]